MYCWGGMVLAKNFIRRCCFIVEIDLFCKNITEGTLRLEIRFVLLFCWCRKSWGYNIIKNAASLATA